MNNAQTKSPPPSFAEAKNSRQKARASGMDPDRWYVVEYDSAVKKEQVKEVTFWNTSIALYRGDDGKLAALQNRCAHRQLKRAPLTLPWIEGLLRDESLHSLRLSRQQIGQLHLPCP